MQITGPYCWQNFDVSVDVSAGQIQQFTIDCEICCRPILCTVTMNEHGEPAIQTEAENLG